jgi:hypothetical protein
MPNGMDEQHTWMSLATLVVFVLIARELMWTRQSALVPSPAGPDGNAGKEEKQPLVAPASEPVLAQVSRTQARKHASTQAPAAIANDRRPASFDNRLRCCCLSL